MSHYASVLPESATYQQSVLGAESVLESESVLGTESVLESESVLGAESESESVPLSYKGDSCSKSCLCEEEPRSITVENEAGDKIVLKAYSTSTENRIVINTVDMSFYEFKGYLADIGMVDDYDVIENKHWQDIKIISACSASLGALSVMGLISWFVLLLQNLSHLR